MWISRKNKIVRIFSLMLATVLLLGSLSSCKGSDDGESTTAPSIDAAATVTEEKAVIHPLTGEKGYDKALLNNRPVVISVENHPDARPQWGLCSSDMVMEMVAEGGITRMLLMYADKSRIPEKVGPVRSARHYFVELVSGFDGIFIHWGASTYAYKEFNKGYCDHLDGKSISSCFYRDKSRYVDLEHTGYTKGSAIIETIADKNIRTTLKDGYASPFKFNDSASALSENACTTCSISYSGSYTYTFKYDSSDKLYYSSLNDIPFVDSDGKQQNFTNLIIIYTDITDLNDAKSRVTFDLDEGNGIYVSNGTYKNITWKKGNATDTLKFFNEDGSELSLNPGRSYIGIVGTGREKLTEIA